MNALPFAVSLLRDYWKLLAAFILGAVLIWPLASCQGRQQANAINSAKIIAASAKVREAAAKAESAAILADMARSVNTTKEADELREIVRETKSDAGVGPATASVLARLRERRGGAARPGS